jgi:hypothetical protein
VSHRVGSDLSYWLITESGKIISKTSVEHVVRNDYLNDDKKAQIDAFDSKLDKALDDEGRSASGDFAFEPLYLQDIYYRAA